MLLIYYKRHKSNFIHAAAGVQIKVHAVFVNAKLIRKNNIILIKLNESREKVKADYVFI